jgi:hypothetical protein
VKQKLERLNSLLGRSEVIVARFRELEGAIEDGALTERRLLYHFTIPSRDGHLGSILRDGEIRTTESNCSFKREHAGPDVVWLLDVPTAALADHGLGDDQGLYAKRLGRVTVEVPDAMRWSSFCIRHRVSRGTMTALAASGGWGSKAWWVLERPIPHSEWVAVDRYVDGIWLPVKSADRLLTEDEIFVRSAA